jgi:hypothetical protein
LEAELRHFSKLFFSPSNRTVSEGDGEGGGKGGSGGGGLGFL